MKIALFGRTINPDYLDYFSLLMKKLSDQKCSISMDKAFYQQLALAGYKLESNSFFSGYEELKGQADFLFSIGGDGTLLEAATLVRDSDIPIVGINLGRMGFLSSISKDNILPAINDILNGRYVIEKRSLLQLSSSSDLRFEFPYALNELSINKRDTSSMILVHLTVNDQFLNSYWADGLLVATPTGSTAYSLSCNGPILTPDSRNFLITSIAPHNLTVRPVVIPDNSVIRIRIESRDNHARVSLDSRSANITSETELVVRKAPFGLNLVQHENDGFFSTLRAKLNWGIDIRN